MKKRKKILLVEDNVINAKLERDFLFHNGFEVIIINNGLEAYTVALDKQPQLIIMDIQLFGTSGINAAIKLKSKQETKHIPILAVSAFSIGSMQRSDTQYDGLFEQHIEKPIDFTLFFKRN